MIKSNNYDVKFKNKFKSIAIKFLEWILLNLLSMLFQQLIVFAHSNLFQ